MEVVNRFENYLLKMAKEAADLCKEVNSPNINILLDIFHGMIEEDDLAEAIKQRVIISDITIWEAITDVYLDGDSFRAKMSARH